MSNEYDKKDPIVKLKINDGNIEMSNPSEDVEIYLVSWQRQSKIADGTPVRIITDSDYQKLISMYEIVGIA